MRIMCPNGQQLLPAWPMYLSWVQQQRRPFKKYHGICNTTIATCLQTESQRKFQEVEGPRSELQ